MDKKETFIAAIQKNEGLIYKISSMYAGNIEDREDLVQEIIYNLWKSFESFSQKSNLSTWMYRVAMNVSIYHFKRAKRKISIVPMDAEVIYFQETDSVEVEERWLSLQQHIKSLNPLDKGIVMLYLENKSHEEIAEIVGISVSNVGTRISRIKEKLKQQILKQQ